MQAPLGFCWLFRERVDKKGDLLRPLRCFVSLSLTWSSSSAARSGRSPWQQRWVDTPRRGRNFPGSGTPRCQQKKGLQNLWGVAGVKISVFLPGMSRGECSTNHVFSFLAKRGILSTDAPGPTCCTIPVGSDFAFQLVVAVPPLWTLFCLQTFLLFIGFLLLTWSSLEEEKEDREEQVEDLHGCQLLVACQVLQSSWKTNGAWSWLEEGLDRPLVFIGPVGLCKCDKSMSNCLDLSGEELVISPLSQVAVNVLQSPQGWISTSCVGYIIWPSAKPDWAAPIFMAFGNLCPTQAPGWVEGTWKSVTIGVGTQLSPSLTVSSGNILSPSPHPRRQADDVKGRGKHWEMLWGDAIVLCHFLNRSQDSLIHRRGLTQNSPSPSILTCIIE